MNGLDTGLMLVSPEHLEALAHIGRLRLLLEEVHKRCGFDSAPDLRARIEAVLR